MRTPNSTRTTTTSRASRPAFSISRYHNGDLANQRFILNAEYGIPVAADMFDTDQPLKHKK